ncbi:P-loop containing nucleoside triphosphate hydrolase protein [Mycena olivaceomarginata]|nr:P-loop containing nucleoside triphosphate hydrolase protein [Mycena olivaceomarginata]
MDTLKLVVVGDHAVGKTSLLISHTKQKFPGYIPSVRSSVSSTAGLILLWLGGDTYRLGLFDTVGQPEYNISRPLTYPYTNVFLVCFSVQSPASFQSVKRKWFPELQHLCPRVPCILVATQVDLRYDQETVQKMAGLGQFPVTTAQSERMAQEVGAVRYIECSAKTLHGVKDVFDEVRMVCLPRQ